MNKNNNFIIIIRQKKKGTGKRPIKTMDKHKEEGRLQGEQRKQAKR